MSASLHRPPSSRSLEPGERVRAPSPSSSFAQTGAEFVLTDDEDDDDLRSEMAGLHRHGGHEAYEMRDASRHHHHHHHHNHQDGGSITAWSSTTHVADPRRASDFDDDYGMDDDEDDEDDDEYRLYTPEEENAVRNKFDRKLVLFVALLYMLSFLDRSNIGNARIAGMDEDLQTDPPREGWYEWALGAFYVSYIAFEWMSLLWKVVPAHVYVSCVVFSWGLVASLQAVATSYPVLVALRALLGVGEAGFTGIPFYLSFFFKRHELAFRTAIFISAAPLATSFASTLAWIIVKLAEVTPIAPWRLLFLVEGFPSVIVAVIAWSVIPDSPQTAPYLTSREKKIARLRLRHEKPIAAANADTDTEGGTPASSEPTSGGVRVRELLAVLGDPVAWITAAMLFLTNMAYSSLPVFLPKILTEMGHSVAASQALSAPPYLAAFVVVLFTAHLSDRVRARTAPLVFHAVCSSLGYALLALAEPLGLPAFLRYLAVYPAAVGFFNVVTLVIAWTINNQASETRQGSGFVMLQVLGQCGPLVGTRLYPDRDAPYYSPGMRACAAAMFAVALLALALRAYMRRLNARMDEAEAARDGQGTAVEEEGLVGPRKARKTPAENFRYML